VESQLKHITLKVREVVDDYRAGRIVIPEFQREYVWKPNKAPRLIDSLYRGFPISSLLLWDNDGEVKERRRDPRPAKRGPLSWLIDGQQRVITLARTIVGDEGIDVVFNPADGGEFKLANAATQKDASWVRVAELWDDELFRAIRRNLDGTRKADEYEARFEQVRRVLDYEIPVVRMVNHSFDGAVDAFTRINTQGVKLKSEDIESAKVAAKHTSFIAERVAPFLQTLRQSGFTRLNVMHLFRACAFVAKPDGRNRTPLHELESREVLEAWKKTEQATGRALELVQAELGLVNMNVLWSGALLVPLIAVCATTQPRGRDARGLIGWLALASLHHRFSGASETALDQDLRACRHPKDPVGALLTNLRGSRGRLKAAPEDFGGGLADRSGLLAAYVACKQRGVLDFFTGGKVVFSKNVDRHHILARAQFDMPERAKSDVVANIAFIAGESNKSLSSMGPEVYLSKLSPKVRESQCIPDDKALWSIDHADEFWAARRELLADAFNDFLKDALEGRHL
jgi:hypothetical protein